MDNGMGYVYVVTHTNAEGLFKIGITPEPITTEWQEKITKALNSK